MSTRFLPMSWTSPFTVARSDLAARRAPRPSPCAARGSVTAAFIASALWSTSATISWLSLKRRPTSSMPVISGPLMISSGCARRRSASVEVVDEPVLACPRRCSARSRSSSGRSLRSLGAAAALRRGSARRRPRPDRRRRVPQSRSSASRRSSSGIDGVALELLGVDDRDVEPGLGAVVEEDRVQHLAAGGGQAEATRWRCRGSSCASGKRSLISAHALDRLDAPSRRSSRRRCRRGRPAGRSQMSSAAHAVLLGEQLVAALARPRACARA